MDQKEWKEKKFGSQFATGGSGLFFFLSLKLYLIISYTAERVPEIISVKTPTTLFKTQKTKKTKTGTLCKK